MGRRVQDQVLMRAAIDGVSGGWPTPVITAEGVEAP